MQETVYSINSFLRYSQFQSPITRLAHPFSTMPTQNFFDQALIFCEFVSTCKKSVYSICSFSRYSQFRVLPPVWSQPFLNMLTPKYLQSPFNLCEFVPTWKKKQLIPSVHSWDTVNKHPFLIMPNKKNLNNFQFLWICINIKKVRLSHWFVLEKKLI